LWLWVRAPLIWERGRGLSSVLESRHQLRAWPVCAERRVTDGEQRTFATLSGPVSGVLTKVDVGHSLSVDRSVWVLAELRSRSWRHACAHGEV
jgi:hypothetical protein